MRVVVRAMRRLATESERTDTVFVLCLPGTMSSTASRDGGRGRRLTFDEGLRRPPAVRAISSFHGSSSGFRKTNGFRRGKTHLVRYDRLQLACGRRDRCYVRTCLSCHLGATPPVPPINDAPTAVQQDSSDGSRSMFGIEYSTMYYEFNCNAGINPKFVAALD
jgi:hypothetical protein